MFPSGQCSDSARRLDVGMVLVNNYFRGILSTPFGGTKHSGYGREHAIEMLCEFTYRKMIRFPPAGPVTGKFERRQQSLSGAGHFFMRLSAKVLGLRRWGYPPESCRRRAAARRVQLGIRAGARRRRSCSCRCRVSAMGCTATWSAPAW
ncbi:aldehyde dehydrogenase family protein [Kitasatospora sp. NPDC058190]|uniref:aldehyde dehydrogenase family protein n=1 Tax=Kitasatospora sp. NPDC058190 TaxID=3346371 RepID=UPI0036D972AC